jgi:hypothetical protein
MRSSETKPAGAADKIKGGSKELEKGERGLLFCVAPEPPAAAIAIFSVPVHPVSFTC